MEPDYTADTRQLVETLDPASALCIGPDCEAIFGTRPGLIKLAAGAGIADRIAHLGRFDFAFLSRTLEYLDRREALMLLSRLRDCHGGHFAVLVPLGEWPGHMTIWTEQELLSLGLTMVSRYSRAHGELRLYAFNIATYKQTPDWFNANHWAHPERWNKEWW